MEDVELLGSFARADLDAISTTGELLRGMECGAEHAAELAALVQRLRVTIDGLLALPAHLVEEREQAVVRAQRETTHDSLTGLAARPLFRRLLSQAINFVQRRNHALVSAPGTAPVEQPRMLAVLVADLDHFQHLNEELGRSAGDVLLREVAARVSRAFARGLDTVGRIGGDTFAVLLADFTDPGEADRAAERLLSVFNDPFSVGAQQLRLSATVGVALFPDDGASESALLAAAEEAQAHAKADRRGSFRRYAHEGPRAISEERQLARSLPMALERHEISTHYQPVVSLQGDVVGTEALMRWTHPEHGSIPPMKFIPLAEESGLISPLGDWIMRDACARTQELHQLGYADQRVAVNLSAHQLRDPGVADMIQRILRETGLPPHCLDVEVTESAAVADYDQARATLRVLRDAGVGVSIDDFGTGHSSLVNVRSLPVTTLKVDRVFVRDIVEDPAAQDFLKQIIVFARNLKLRVVVEGVETQAQLAVLRSIVLDDGLDAEAQSQVEVQGYVFSRPLPHGELAAVIDRGFSSLC